MGKTTPHCYKRPRPLPFLGLWPHCRKCPRPLCCPAGISLPCSSTESRVSTAQSMAQPSSQTSAPSPGLGQPQLQARPQPGPFQVVLRKAGAVHHCVPALAWILYKEAKKGPFFHLQRHLVVFSNIIKLTIFKCFVTSVILWLSTGQAVILLLLASLDTVCSAVSNHLAQGAKSSHGTLQEQFQFKPAG